jgi:hypothetical protein
VPGKLLAPPPLGDRRLPGHRPINYMGVRPKYRPARKDWELGANAIITQAALVVNATRPCRAL